MNLRPEKKKEILLQSFDVLKEDYSENAVKLSDTIRKMFAIDIDTAVEMWIFLLKKHRLFLKTNEGFWDGGPFYQKGVLLTISIIDSAKEKIGESRIFEIIINNAPLKKAIFNQYIDQSARSIMGIIHNYIYSNNPAVVNDLLELVYTNKNSDESFGKYFEMLLDRIGKNKSLSEEVLGVLLSWTDKVTNKQEKAKINVALLDILSGQDKSDK